MSFLTSPSGSFRLTVENLVARAYQPRTACSRSCCRCATTSCRCCSGAARSDPFEGAWALPGGQLEPDETLEQSIRRHLAAKVDVRELAHLEQLETRSDPDRNPARRELATAYLGLVPTGVDPAVPQDTPGTRSTPPPHSRSTTARSRSPGGRGCGRSSRTRTSASRSRPRRSRSRSCATSTPPRSGTTSRRRTCSGCSCAEACSSRRASAARPAAPAGGRPRLPLPLARPRDHGPVRRASSTRLTGISDLSDAAVRRPPPALERRRAVRRRDGVVPRHALDRRQPVPPRAAARPLDRGVGQVRRPAAAGDPGQPAPPLRPRPAVVPAVHRLRRVGRAARLRAVALVPQPDGQRRPPRAGAGVARARIARGRVGARARPAARASSPGCGRGGRRTGRRPSSRRSATRSRASSSPPS